MKAEDLMIGDYVLCRGAVSIVTSINNDSISYITNKGKSERNIPLKLVKPIPLNESELERLGVDVKGFDKRSFCRTLSKDGVKFMISNSGNVYHRKIYIGTVHHLQNLFFIIKGYHLEYKK